MTMPNPVRYVYVAFGATFQHREAFRKAPGWTWQASEKVWTHRVPEDRGEDLRLREWLKKLPGVSTYQEDARRFGVV